MMIGSSRQIIRYNSALFNDDQMSRVKFDADSY